MPRSNRTVIPFPASRGETAGSDTELVASILADFEEARESLPLSCQGARSWSIESKAIRIRLPVLREGLQALEGLATRRCACDPEWVSELRQARLEAMRPLATIEDLAQEACPDSESMISQLEFRSELQSALADLSKCLGRMNDLLRLYHSEDVPHL